MTQSSLQSICLVYSSRGNRQYWWERHSSRQPEQEAERMHLQSKPEAQGVSQKWHKAVNSPSPRPGVLPPTRLHLIKVHSLPKQHHPPDPPQTLRGSGTICLIDPKHKAPVSLSLEVPVTNHNREGDFSFFPRVLERS